MEHRIEDLVNSYIYNIANLNTKELFMANLPNLFFDSSEKIINSIIKYLEFELETAEEMQKSYNSREDINLLEEEINTIKNKISWCSEKIKEKEIEQEEQHHLQESPNINIIFAKKNGSEITHFEDDLLKDVPREYYKDVFECLERTRKFGFNENNEKQKMIGSVDKKLKGICELKNYQIRIIYKYLDKNTIYITQVYVKKDDKNKKIKESMINRDARIYEKYLEMKKQIENPEYKDYLIQESASIENKILEEYAKNIKGDVDFEKK